MLEIDGDLAADIGLDLSQPPVGAIGMADDGARFEERIQSRAHRGAPVSEARDLSDLVSSRICHDLVSPLGAIGNGAELLQMTGQSDGPEVALIAQSVSHANARLRFFRIAFGAAPPGAMIARSEVRDILAGLAEGARVRTHWQAEGDPDRGAAKLVFLILQCLESAMPRGGAIEVTREDALWRLTATGQGMTPDPTLAPLLSEAEAAADPTPATVHFAIARDLLSQSGRRVTADLDGAGLTLSF